MSFDLFLAIDYSGARTPTARLPGLQVYAARAGEEGCERWSSPASAQTGRPLNWTRAELAQRLLTAARSGRRFLAGIADEFRLTERWTSSAKSVFQFDVQGSVAKSSHAGIPWLKWLRDQAGDRLHFWPFDGWTPPEDKSVIAEVYASLFRNRYPREGRTIDEQDAYASARWMADMAERGALEDYFAPPLTEAERRLADCEGWILGVR